MRHLEVDALAPRGKSPFEGLLGHEPKPDEYREVVDAPALLVEGGRRVGVYVRLEDNVLAAARHVMERARFADARRSAGLPTRSAIFGSMPRVPHRNAYCRFTAESMRAPDLLAAVRIFARAIAEVYREHLPDAYEAHRHESLASIDPTYLLPDTPFTTCNFNVNTAIKHHRDTGNAKGVFSNVIILARHIRGGELVMPEFGIALAQKHGALALFDGQRIIHGVRPIRRLLPTGYRCSIVLYALDQMRNCYPLADEIEHAREWREEVESQWRRPERVNPVPQGRMLSTAIKKRFKAGDD